MLVIIMIPNFVGAMSMVGKNQEGPGFYRLSRDDLRRFVKSIGYSEKFSWFVNRDSTGSMLRLFNWDDKKAIVMSCEGGIREIPLKGEKCWLNDKLEVVAWFDKQRINFDDKEISSSEEYIYKQELSGSYFFRSSKWEYHKHHKPSSFNIEIFSVNNPGQPLIEVEMLDSTARLFTKYNKVYLAGNLPTNRNVIKFYVYEINNGSLIKTNEVTLNRDEETSSPFYVVDMNPWKDEAIVVDIHDFPSRSKLFAFNLLSQEKISIGSGTEGFYLQCNILNEVLRKREQN